MDIDIQRITEFLAVWRRKLYLRSIPLAEGGAVRSYSFLDDVPKELEYVVYVTSTYTSGSSQTLSFFALVKDRWSAIQSDVLVLDEDGLEYHEWHCIADLSAISLDALKEKIGKIVMNSN